MNTTAQTPREKALEFLATIPADQEYVQLPRGMKLKDLADAMNEIRPAPNPSTGITANEAMAKLKEAFPTEYITVQVEIASHYTHNSKAGERHDDVEFSCYTASAGHNRAKTLDDALRMALAKIAKNGDAAGEIDRINAEVLNSETAQ